MEIFGRANPKRGVAGSNHCRDFIAARHGIGREQVATQFSRLITLEQTALGGNKQTTTGHSKRIHRHSNFIGKHTFQSHRASVKPIQPVGIAHVDISVILQNSSHSLLVKVLTGDGHTLNSHTIETVECQPRTEPHIATRILVDFIYHLVAQAVGRSEGKEVERHRRCADRSNNSHNQHHQNGHYQLLYNNGWFIHRAFHEISVSIATIASIYTDISFTINKTMHNLCIAVCIINAIAVLDFAVKIRKFRTPRQFIHQF